MKTYRMRKIDDGQFGYVVYSANYANPLEQRRVIEGELARKKFSGYVVFDLLLTVGDEDNRFSTLFFDGERFDMDTFSVVNSIENSIRRKSAKFYVNNKDIFESSILSRLTRFRITREASL